jgi:hypothetical protein
MIYTAETLKDVKTPSDVKYALLDTDYFFNRKTMKFFGDKMTSFGVRTINGKRIMYRKPTARVNVFGTWKTAGRDFFNAWELIPKNDHIDLQSVSDEEKKSIYLQVS